MTIREIELNNFRIYKGRNKIEAEFNLQMQQNSD